MNHYRETVRTYLLEERKTRPASCPQFSEWSFFFVSVTFVYTRYVYVGIHCRWKLDKIPEFTTQNTATKTERNERYYESSTWFKITQIEKFNKTVGQTLNKKIKHELAFAITTTAVQILHSSCNECKAATAVVAVAGASARRPYRRRKVLVVVVIVITVHTWYSVVL